MNVLKKHKSTQWKDAAAVNNYCLIFSLTKSSRKNIRAFFLLHKSCKTGRSPEFCEAALFKDSAYSSFAANALPQEEQLTRENSLSQTKRFPPRHFYEDDTNAGRLSDGIHPVFITQEVRFANRGKIIHSAWSSTQAASYSGPSPPVSFAPSNSPPSLQLLAEEPPANWWC